VINELVEGETEMQLLNARQKTAPNADEIWSVKTWCAGHLGLADVDLSRLGDRDGLRAMALLNQLCLEGRDGYSWEQLTEKERKQLERLLAKASGLGPDAFQKAREEAEMIAEIKRLAYSPRRTPLTRKQTDDFLSTLFVKLQTTHWFGEHLVVFLACASQLTSGKTFAAGARVEGRGDQATLIFRVADGPARIGSNGADCIASWRWSLPWLARFEWLTMEEHRGEVRVRLGKAAIRALGGPERRPAPSLRERLQAAKAKQNGDGDAE
jgi:hypothetical protein